MAINQQRLKAKLAYRAMKEDEIRNMKPSEMAEILIDLRDRMEKLEKRMGTYPGITVKSNINSTQPKKLLSQKLTKESSYSDKIIFVLDKADKPMYLKDILEHMKKLDQQVLESENPQTLIRVVLSRMVKSKRLKVAKSTQPRRHIYLLPQWTKKGQLLPQYQEKLDEMFWT